VGKGRGWTYALGGDDLAAAAPLGLRLALWGSAMVVVRVAEGEEDEAVAVEGAWAGRSDG
jgi:hypothetical protein